MVDCFSLLNLPREFDIDPQDLESRYLRACMSIHPDHLHDSGSSFVAAAESSLASINQAYETLRNPVSRAEHLLLLSGGAAANEDRSVSNGFLESMLELRESMAEAANHSQLSQLENTIKLKQQQSKAKIPYLCTFPMNSERQKLLRKLLNEIAFLDSFEQDLRAEAGF